MANNLESRLTQNTNTPAQQRPKTMADQIRAMTDQFQMAAPKGMEAQQLVRDALTALRQNPQLGECDPATVLGGLMTCSQLGLRPGVLGQAWLLPFWDNKARTRKAQLVIGYQGLVELAYRSGRIESVSSRVVYENDEFELIYELSGDRMIHRPTLDGHRGKPRLFYAVAQIKGGGHAVTDPMTLAEMEEYRDKFAMAKTREGKIVGPWRDNFEEMAKKTMLRRLAKLLPKSTELATAIEADNSVRVDLTPAAVDYPEHIDGELVDDQEAVGQPVEPTAEGVRTE